MNQIIEQWRPVVGWEGFYEVSDQGRVRSLERTVVSAAGIAQRLKGGIMRYRINRRRGGYATVALCRNGAYDYQYVHRLVLQAFIGDPPYGMQAAHGDGNPLNNCLRNLRWATCVDNIRDKQSHGTQLKGEAHGASRLTDDQAASIRAEYTRTAYNRSNSAELARKYGVTRANIWAVVTGKTFKHLPLGSTDYLS